MTVQATSMDAFNTNKTEFASMGERILAFMQTHHETRTRAEIAQALSIPTATMSGRVNALIKKGRLIEEPGRFKCSVTGNMVRGVSAAT